MQTVRQRKALGSRQAVTRALKLKPGVDVRFTYGATGTIQQIDGPWFHIRLADGQVKKFKRSQFSTMEVV